jgi:hypothetical protein
LGLAVAQIALVLLTHELNGPLKLPHLCRLVAVVGDLCNDRKGGNNKDQGYDCKDKPQHKNLLTPLEIVGSEVQQHHGNKKQGPWVHQKGPPLGLGCLRSA